MNTHDTEHQADADTHFSTAVAGLPTAVETDVVDLAEGDHHQPANRTRRQAARR